MELFEIGTTQDSQILKILAKLLFAYWQNENFEETVSMLHFYLSVTLNKDQAPPKLAQTSNNSAFFYLLQQDYTKAAPLIQRALQIKEKTLGKNHPSTAITLNNLALMYGLQECYDEAESLYQRSFEIVNTSFGNNHPQVAAALNNLAELYKIQGRDEEANSLHQRSAAIQETGNDKKTTAFFQHVIRVLSNSLDQARYDDLRRKLAEQAVAEQQF